MFRFVDSSGLLGKLTPTSTAVVIPTRRDAGLWYTTEVRNLIFSLSL